MKKFYKKFLFHVSCSMFHDRSGAAALLTVIIVSVAALIMAYSASLLSMGELEMGYDSGQGGEAFSIADGCIDESFRRLRLNDSNSGGSLSLGDGSCIIGVSGTGSTRIIIATSTLDNYHKKIKTSITFSGNANEITIDSWQESNE